jgi:hypothetical protein
VAPPVGGVLMSTGSCTSRGFWCFIRVPQLVVFLGEIQGVVLLLLPKHDSVGIVFAKKIKMAVGQTFLFLPQKFKK